MQALAAGALVPSERAATLAHVASCTECADVLAALLRDGEPSQRAHRVGEVIAGRYRIEAPLGHGGMGTVYAAFDEELKVEVALKGIAEELRNKPEIEALLKREIVLSRRVHSRHVCRVHELARQGDEIFIVMERLDGPTLRMRLLTGPLSKREATDVLRGVAEAVAEIHRVGIVHRDIKPSNVMLDAGRAVLMDFGLSREMDSTTTQSLISGGGTPAYWAPEQGRGERASKRSDVYALGRLAEEIASACDDESVRRRVEPVVAVAMRSDPNRRYAGGDAFRIALERSLRYGGLVMRTALAAGLLVAAGAAWIFSARTEAPTNAAVPNDVAPMRVETPQLAPPSRASTPPMHIDALDAAVAASVERPSANVARRPRTEVPVQHQPRQQPENDVNSEIIRAF